MMDYSTPGNTKKNSAARARHNNSINLHSAHGQEVPSERRTWRLGVRAVLRADIEVSESTENPVELDSWTWNNDGHSIIHES